MKNLKRAFAVVLSLMLLLCSLPLAASAEDTVTIPEMNNTYNVVESVSGKVMEATYAANTNAYWSGNQFTKFGPFDCTNAVYLELDVYTSAEANASGEINLSTTAEDPNNKAAYNFGTLEKGWNHKVFTLKAGTLNLSTIGSAFLAGVFSETESAHIIIANIAFTTDIPNVNNTYYALATITGKLNGGTVPANTNAWETCLANTTFVDTDITGAKYVEMDVYVSAPVNDSEGENAEINLGYGFNDAGNKNNYTFPALSVGWNHVVFELKSNNINYGKLNNAFMACTFSTDSNVEFKIANLSFTTSKSPMPEVSNIYYAIATIPGKLNGGTVPANTNAWNTCQAATTFADTDITGAKYVEMDIYVSAPVNDSEGENAEINIAYGGNNDSNKNNYTFPALSIGWNHVVFDIGSRNLNYGKLNYAFMACTFSTDSNVEFEIANLSFTTSKSPMPEVNNTYFEVATIPGKLNGGTVPANTNAWETCLANTTFVDTDITGAKYVEMDVYVSAPVNDSEGENAEINLGYGFNDAGNKNNYTFPALSVGWNHVVFELKNNNLNYGKLNNAFMACTFSTDSNVEFEIANLSFTKLVPDMKNTHRTIAARDGKFMEITYPAGANAYFSNNLFTTFGPFDCSDAVYFELDIYTSAEANVSGEINLSDGTDNALNKAAYNFGTLNKGWNHKVFTLRAGSLDPVKIGSAFLAGVFSATEDAHIIVANIAFTTDKYKVIWANEDGTVLETDKVVLDTIPEYNGETPVKAADGNTVYTFAGWDKEIVAVTGDVTYTATYTATTYVAEVNGVKYETLAEAVANAQSGATVTLLGDASGAGVVVDKDITIDFGGYTYTLTEGVGSTGTETNGLQLLAGNNVVLNNGTLTVSADAADKFYILVQNYANLTVTDMILDGTYLDKYAFTDGDSYTLSNNSGTVNVEGKTSIIANNDGDLAFAFDVCKFGGYEAPVVNVNITGTVTGAIEVTAEIADNLNISGGTFTVALDTAWCAEGFMPVPNGDGTYGVADAYVIGDANNDTAVDILDLIKLKNALLDEAEYSYFADVDVDGDVDAIDFTELRKLLFASF